MSEKVVSSSSSAGVTPQQKSSQDYWAKFMPVSVDYEDTFSKEKVRAIWSKLYSKVGMSSANEDELRAIRFAIYLYCAKNGTSREGDYSGVIVSAGGKRFDASVIPHSATKFGIRKFMRGNSLESYEFLKKSGALTSDEKFVAKAALMGIGDDALVGMCDWLGGCPSFTTKEVLAYETAFNRGLERARRARGGKTLENLEADRVDLSLEAQGPQESGRSVW